MVTNANERFIRALEKPLINFVPTNENEKLEFNNLLADACKFVLSTLDGT